MEDRLIVIYDNCPPDTPTLIVAKQDKYDIAILNQFQDDKAFCIYHFLTGGAELKNKPIETNADKIRSMNDEELAEFLNNYHSNNVATNEICHAGLCLDGEDCVGCTLRWLQKSIKK